MKRRVVTIVVVLAVLALAIGAFAWSKATASTEVTATTVNPRTLDVVVTAKGTVEAAHPRGVFSPVEGRLTSIKVADGAQVTAGQVLATLDPAPLKLAVTQAEAQLAAARAMPTGTDRLNSARSHAIDAAQATLDTARANLANATLKAPVAGELHYTSLSLLPGAGPLYKTQEGASVSPGLAVFTIVTPGDLAFTAQIDESDIAGVKVGTAAKVTLDAFADTPFAGKVASIQPTAVQTSTGGVAFPTTITLTDAKGVMSGMTGDADLTTQTIKDALVVPLQAVQTADGKRFVYVIRDAKAIKTEVTAGASTDTEVQIKSGLKAGDQVATSQLSALSDGAKVHVK